MHHRCLVVVLTLAVGCAGPSEPATDAGPDLDAEPSPLVGVWREIPVNPQPEANRAVLTVAADHSFVLVRGAVETSGTWEIDGDDRLHWTSEGTTMVGEYYVDETRLVRDVVYPVGAVDGVVGSWTGSGITIDLEADLSVTISYGFVGTYEVEGASIFMNGKLGDNPSSLYVQAIPDVVLGTPMYERL